MRKLVVAMMIGTLSLGVHSAFAATAQQDKMKTCNADATAKSLKGDERKAFMKSCLSASTTTAAKATTPQQEKMKACNAEAGSKSLKGDARKSFMKDCLSGKAAAPAA
ncbi:MAG: PsiF family protein [Pseudomonadota bacterium]